MQVHTPDVSDSTPGLLIREAENHRAVHHPYLKALAAGEFRNMSRILTDFASQYGHYSAWFPRYLTAVISKLENAGHRQQLLENLAEERGELHEEDLIAIRSIGIKDEWVQGIPHPELFRRFQKAMDVHPDSEPGIEVSVWRESFLSLIQSNSAVTAVAAIGPGTETVVKHIYHPIIEAIRNHTNLSLEDYVFFPLHTEVDDEHGQILLSIAAELAASGPEQALELRKGMLKALNLRAAFWDDMLERALIIDNK
jgi:pyrroloquinoline quinone (PQQ) biosynthesis protein C